MGSLGVMTRVATPALKPASAAKTRLPASRTQAITRAARGLPSCLRTCLRSTLIFILLLQGSLVAIVNVPAEADHDDFLHVRFSGEEGADLADSDARGPFDGERIRAGTDRGKGDAAETVLLDQRKTASIAACQ